MIRPTLFSRKTVIVEVGIHQNLRENSMQPNKRLIQQGLLRNKDTVDAVASKASEQRWANRRDRNTPAHLVIDAEMLGSRAAPSPASSRTPPQPVPASNSPAWSPNGGSAAPAACPALPPPDPERTHRGSVHHRLVCRQHDRRPVHRAGPRPETYPAPAPRREEKEPAFRSAISSRNKSTASAAARPRLSSLSS